MSWQNILDGASSKRKSTFNKSGFKNDFNRANFELLKERIVNLERQVLELADIIGEQAEAFETALLSLQKFQREQEEINRILVE